MRALLWVPVLCLACDDHLFLPEGGTIAPGWCGVEPVLTRSCASGGCHDAAAATGGLDLETDPLGAIVGVESTTYAGAVYVAPGDAAASLLYQKVAGTQGEGLGGRMPIGAPLGAAELAAIKAWIDEGAGPCEVDP